MNGKKAFVFSLDAVLAILIFASVIATFTVSEKKFYVSSGLDNSSDAFRVLESNGYLQNEIDSNALTISAQNIYSKVVSMLPDRRGLRVELKQYSLDYEACRSSKDFNACFPNAERLSASYGDSIPANKDLVKGRSIIVKKQAPGDCNLNYISLAGKPEKSVEWEVFGKLLLLEPFYAYFAPKDPDDIGLTVDVNTVPSSSLQCDENLVVNLSATVSENIRNKADIQLVIDRSGSMNECSVVDGNALAQNSGSIGGGTRYCSWWIIPNILCGTYDYNGWVKVADFNITNLSAFDAKLEWVGGAGDGWHNMKFYIEAPNGTKYGYYGGEPSQGCYDSYTRMIYLGVPSSLSQNGNWKAYAWNDDPSVPYTATTVKSISAPKTKLDAAKDASKQFVDDANWTSDDFTGLTSYATTAKTDQPLTSNRIAVKNKIDTLNGSGSTATGEGIYEATEELQEPPSGHARPDSVRFQVLLSDGKTNAGRSSEDAAYDAKDKNIVIFTIGFGYEADEDELRTIAEITGGEYYYATDDNALQKVYEVIAMRIQQISSTSRIIVPIPEGSEVVDPGPGSIIDGNIVFETDGIFPGSGWYGSYVLRFDCNQAENCDINSITVPGEGSLLVYTDSLGNQYEVPIDTNVVLSFLTRDLRVDIFKGELLGKNDLYLDVNVANIGGLTAGQTDLRFRLDDLNGNLLSTIPVPSLCGAKDENCLESSRVFNNVGIKQEGVIYAVVNEDGSVSECPLGDYDAIRCYGGPAMQFFAIDYYVWVKG